MFLSVALMVYLLLSMTLMHIGLGMLAVQPEVSTQKQRDAVLWWAWLWPYMLVRQLVVKVHSWR
jgi:hypothetical protein